MIITITGGSSSGKSAMAESAAMKLEPGKKLYIATMVRTSSMEDPIIARHKELRKNKNFVTLECPYDLQDLEISDDDTVLVECISNLLANELYDPVREELNSLPSERVISSLEALSKKCKNLICVTNEVFSDGIVYDDKVMTYIEEFGKINRYLMRLSDVYAESVYGIPYYYTPSKHEAFF